MFYVDAKISLENIALYATTDNWNIFLKYRCQMYELNVSVLQANMASVQ
jgi:hypothetical protein